MTAPSSIDPAHFLHEQLAQASPDLMRELLGTFINSLLSAQADSVCGAEYGTLEAILPADGHGTDCCTCYGANRCITLGVLHYPRSARLTGR